jgi:alkaline phosphatase
MKKTLLTACLLAATLIAGETPKNIILFIGDGMGTAQITAGKVVKGALEMERCPEAGLMTTWSADRLVTDSAAAATAMATGVKTKNGMISIDPEGKRLKTVLELAEEKKKSTGLVCTCAITHATPAGFAAHVPSRKQSGEIARQLAAGDVDVLFGGGLDHFSPEALSELKSKMRVATDPEGFRTLGSQKKAAALLYPEHPPLAPERDISLSELTAKALEILSQDRDGFFLMVEGSQIDWMGHQNKGPELIAEVVDFDDAVGVGLDFAEADGNTLVIITADHETGGFSVIDGSAANRTVSQTIFAHKQHTAAMVPVFSLGPGSSRFSGIIDNTDVAKQIIDLLKAPQTKIRYGYRPGRAGLPKSHR